MSNINWQDAKKEVSFDKGYVIAIFTDKVVVSDYPLTDDDNIRKFDSEFEDKILDCRIFDSEKEYRWFRGDIGRTIKCRVLDDAHGGDHFDRSIYLDIDTKKSKGGQKVFATGGGEYSLPISKISDAKIKIREYLKYDEFGNARVYDWRVLDLLEGGQ